MMTNMSGCTKSSASAFIKAHLMRKKVDNYFCITTREGVFSSLKT